MRGQAAVAAVHLEVAQLQFQMLQLQVKVEQERLIQ
jgi:hypothetical protein